MMSTPRGYHDSCLDIMSISRCVQYTSEGYHEYIKGYLEYIRGCSVH